MAHGISFLTQFPQALRDNAPGTSQIVPVSKVRVVLYRADSSVALDTMVTFPDGKDSVTVSMDVPLSPTAPASGEPMSMNLKYVSPAGDTVFRGAAPIVATAATVSGGSGGGTPPPAQVTVTVTYTGTGATAKSVVIAPRTQQVFIGQTFTWSASALDASGNALANTPVKWTSLDTAVAGITNAASGVGTTNKRGTARIVAELLTGPKDTVILTVNAAASAIAGVSGDNQTSVVGQQLANPLVVRVLGSDALPLAGTPITVTFGTGATAPVSQLTTDENGLASTTWTLAGTAGPQTATFAATGLSGSPVTFKATATPGAATALAATVNPPASIVAGQSLGTVQFTARDAFGNPAPSFAGSVTVALTGGAAGAVLGGTTVATATAGVVTFSDLVINTAGTGYALVASSPGLASGTSTAFAVTPAPWGRLVVITNPASTVIAGTTLPSIAVQAVDAFGNVATSFTGAVSLALNGGTGTTTLGGTTTVNAVAGVATFSSAKVSTVGTGYTLVASSPGLASGTSTAFAVTPAPWGRLVVITNPASTVIAGATLPDVAVQAVDAFGNVATEFAGTVSVAVNATSGAVLGGTTTANAVAGLARFTDLKVSKVGTGYVLSFAAAGLTSTTTTPFAVTPGAAVGLQFGTQPANGTADGPIPTFAVRALDSYGNLATAFTTPISLSLGSTNTATLDGTVTATPVSGVATFNAARITRAGTGYQLSAAASGVSAATSSAFAIGAGVPAACTAVSAPEQSYFVGALLPITPMVQVADASGNLISGATVNFAASGGGVVGTATGVTGVTGVTGATSSLSSSWTLGTTVGAQTLTASCAGVTTPATFTAAARARGLTLNAGGKASIATASVNMAGTLVIPVVLDLTYPQGTTLASASFDLTFDTNKFTFVSSTVGTFGSVFENTSAAASGKVTVGVFSPTAATASTTLYTITLLPKNGAANTTSTVGLVVTAAGNENAVAVPLAVRPLLVSIVP